MLLYILSLFSMPDVALDLMFNQTWGLLYDPQSTIAAFKAKNGYESATSGS
jgi:nickel transport system substrate-binding protein